jgi:hypothetical protein
MWLLRIAIILFIIWLISLAVARTITEGMWFLLAFAVAFLIVHFCARIWIKPAKL